MADLKQIIVCLENTYNPNANERQQAENLLNQFERVNGYLVCLMQIITSNEVNEGIRLAAAIYMKKLSAHNWARDEESEYIPENFFLLPQEDKNVLKQNIVEILIRSPPKLRQTIGVVMRNIATFDFPDQWPELIPKLLTYLTSRDMAVTYGAMEATYFALKKWEHLPPGKGRRKPLYEVVKVIFPVLIELLKWLCTLQTLESAYIQKIILRSFWAACNYGIPPYLIDTSTLSPWISVFIEILLRPIPEGQEVADVEDRPQSPWWKCKKWVAIMFHYLLLRYGDIKAVDGADVKAFARLFIHSYVPKILETMLTIINIKRNGGFLTERLLQESIAFLDAATRNNKIFKLFKDKVDGIFQSIVFPLLCFNENDWQLWKEDPLDYLKKEFDVVEEFYDPRTSATIFLINIGKYRGKTCLPSIMNFLAQVLNRYETSSPEMKNPKEKDGALTVIGTLSSKLIFDERYVPVIENMIIQYILPEFSSPHPFLRAKACWVFGQFSTFDFKNPQTFLAGLRSLLSCMKDGELPVRIQASVNIAPCLESELATTELRGILPQLLEALLAVMNEFDNEEIVHALERLVDEFEEEMTPYALQLTKTLTDTYLRLLESSAMNDDEEAEGSLAAAECLTTLQTLLYSIKDKANLLEQAEQILLPLIQKLLDPEALEDMEEGLKILSFLTFFQDRIRPQVWALFPMMYQAFLQCGMDFISDLLTPIDNMIAKDPDTFLAGPYLGMVIDMIQRCVADPRVNEVEAGEGCKLAEVVLSNCRGRINHLVDPMIQMALQRLSIAKKTFLKVLLLEVVLWGLQYDTNLAVASLDARGQTEPFFKALFTLLPKFKRGYDKKIVAIAFTSVLCSPVVPPSLHPFLPTILQVSIALLWELEEMRKKAEEAENEVLSPEEEEPELITGGYELEEDEEADEFADDGDQVFQDDKDSGDEFDDFDESDQDEDDDDFITPLDEVDEIILFTENITRVAAADPAFYEKLIGSITPDIQARLKELFPLADLRRQLIEKMKQEELAEKQQHQK